MNDQYAPTQSSDDGEPPFVYLNQQMLGKLAQVGVADSNSAGVLLVLSRSLNPEGYVIVSLTEVVQLCRLPLKKVKASLFALAGGDLIESLNLSDLAAGTVSCRINPDLIRYGKSNNFSAQPGTPTKAD